MRETSAVSSKIFPPTNHMETAAETITAVKSTLTMSSGRVIPFFDFRFNRLFMYLILFYTMFIFHQYSCWFISPWKATHTISTLSLPFAVSKNKAMVIRHRSEPLKFSSAMNWIRSSSVMKDSPGFMRR